MNIFKPFFLLLCFQAVTSFAQVAVLDAHGNRVELAKPAKRIISLAPHITDLVYEAGAGNQLVGITSESDYLVRGKKVTVIGSYSGVSVEAILRQKPDLILTWANGGYAKELARLKGMGIPVYISHPLKLEDVGSEIQAIGTLSGNSKVADASAQNYIQKLNHIKQKYAQKERVKTFIQINQSPMFTVSKNSFLGQMVEDCRGNNIFGDLPQAAPQINVEAVLRAKPQVIISTGSKAALNSWQRWSIPATKQKHLYALTSKHATLPSPLVLEALEMMCTQIDSARSK